jgi:DNA-binding transcriptional MerR regulator
LQLKEPLTKLYYSIGEVADLLKVNTSLIRFWEKEFVVLHPKKSKSGIRKYTSKDIETLVLLYTLIKEEGHTLDGAKKFLKTHTTPKDANDISSPLGQVLSKLEGLKKRLESLIEVDE